MTELREKAFYYGLKPEEYNESTFPDLIGYINQQIERESKDIRRQYDIMRRQTAHLLGPYAEKNQPITPQMIVQFADEPDPEEEARLKAEQMLAEYEKFDFSGADAALKKAGLLKEE